MIGAKHNSPAFSLIEVTLSLAIAAVALVSILGLVPTVMDNHRAGADQQALGTIYEDLHDRIEGAELIDGPIQSAPFFYTAEGHFIPNALPPKSPEVVAGIGGAFFRAEASIVSVVNSPGMNAVKISVFWPLSDKRLPIAPDAPGSRLTYIVTPLTGKGWEEVDSEFQPTIEH
jgi:type II secretory pathway pseudopilin PulG|tara:strand:- start:868 stop:1386 length:519 start_codon:yes stop_codon:yes gene_type:complete